MNTHVLTNLIAGNSIKRYRQSAAKFIIYIAKYNNKNVQRLFLGREVHLSYID